MIATLLVPRFRCEVAIDFRRSILDKLKKLGKSKYWLSEKLDGTPSVNALYTYLRDDSDTDMKGAHIAKILDVLDGEERKQR